MRIPELLIPAGGMEQLRAAVSNGADAVYMSGASFNARLNADNFSDSELGEAIDFAHEHGVKVHITQNTLVRNDEMQAAVENALRMYELGADALIIQDRGLAAELKKIIPDMPLHLSTQGTVYNIEGAAEAEKDGFDRVILARELSAEEITSICRASDAEIEVFVHGAICICYSGQCHMSHYIGGRSGNRGACAQPCRLPYDLILDGKIAGGGYPLSPCDMNLIEHLKRLAEAGVASLKIEGRMKSPEYVAVVTSVYRKYLDAVKNGSFNGVSIDDMNRLKQVFNRGDFTDAYFTGESGKTLMSDDVPKHKGLRIGKITGADTKKGHAVISLEAELSNGDGIEIRSRSGKIICGGVITYIRKEYDEASEKNKGVSGKEASRGDSRCKNEKKGGKNAKNSASRDTRRNNNSGPSGKNKSRGTRYYAESNASEGRYYEKKEYSNGRRGEIVKTASAGDTVSTGDLNELKNIRDISILKGCEVYKITDKKLMDEARASYAKPPSGNTGIVMNFYAETGYKAVLTAYCEKDGTSAICESENIIEAALNRPADEESIRQRLSKTGGTPFYVESCSVELKGEPAISAAELNAMRRAVTDSLTAQRITHRSRPAAAQASLNLQAGAAAPAGDPSASVAAAAPTGGPCASGAAAPAGDPSASGAAGALCAAASADSKSPALHLQAFSSGDDGLYSAYTTDAQHDAAASAGAPCASGAAAPAGGPSASVAAAAPCAQAAPTVSLYFYRTDSAASRIRETISLIAAESLPAEKIEIFIPFEYVEDEDIRSLASAAGIRIIACLPPISKAAYSGAPLVTPEAARRLAALCGSDAIYGISVANASQLVLLEEYAGKIRLFFDENMNIFNRYTVADFIKKGMTRGVISHELSPSEISDFSGYEKYCEFTVRGRVPLMLMEHCPAGSAGNASGRFCSEEKKYYYCRKGNYSLRDRKGKEYPLITDERVCRCTVMSHSSVDYQNIYEKLKKTGIAAARFCIYDESAKEIVREIVHFC